MERRKLAVISVVVFGALMRFLPHAPNFLPLTAMALFAGSVSKSKWYAFLSIGGAMLLSDIFLGFHSTMPFVYLAMAITILLGGAMLGTPDAKAPATVPVAGASLTSSLLFFIITNFGVWATQTLYPKTVAGLIVCYTEAIPFFGNSIVSDLFYSFLLFGVVRVLERTSYSLSPQAV